MACRYAGLRTIRHHGLLAEYLGSRADHREDRSVPKMPYPGTIIVEGSWADIGREVRFRKIWKERRLLDRRLSRKAKMEARSRW